MQSFLVLNFTGDQIPEKLVLQLVSRRALYIIIIIVINLFSVDQINRTHNYSIFPKTIANIENKC